MKVEIRIKTKNGIEDILKQQHGEADKGKKVPTNRWSQSAIKPASGSAWCYTTFQFVILDNSFILNRLFVGDKNNRPIKGKEVRFNR